MRTLATNLKQKRVEQGLTQVEVAQATHLSTVGYQNYETGKRIPRTDILQRIAVALNSTVEELLKE